MQTALSTLEESERATKILTDRGLDLRAVDSDMKSARNTSRAVWMLRERVMHASHQVKRGRRWPSRNKLDSPFRSWHCIPRTD